MNCMIIDDDKGDQIELSLLMRQNHLANVTAQLESGEHALDEIMMYRPEILLIDLMLSEQGGLDIIREVQNRGYDGKILVVSAVNDPDIISCAYEKGIFFYLLKPVNREEFIHVINHAKRMIELEHSIAQIKGILSRTDQNLENVHTVHQGIEERLYEIFTELGIVGFSGTEEILEVLKCIYRIQKLDEKSIYHLKDIYREVCIKLYGDENRAIVQKNMEQRIRRTIQKALGNIAEIGCEDYYDPIFTKYANVLFDFKQVRQEMQHIKDPHAYSGKINTKKFMKGILSRVD